MRINADPNPQPWKNGLSACSYELTQSGHRPKVIEQVEDGRWKMVLHLTLTSSAPAGQREPEVLQLTLT